MEKKVVSDNQLDKIAAQHAKVLSAKDLLKLSGPRAAGLTEREVKECHDLAVEKVGKITFENVRTASGRESYNSSTVFYVVGALIGGWIIISVLVQDVKVGFIASPIPAGITYGLRSKYLKKVDKEYEEELEELLVDKGYTVKIGDSPYTYKK